MTRLTVREAAKYIGVAKSTLDHLRSAGGGPHYRKIGRKVVYDAADLDKWIEQFPKRRSTSDNPQARPRRRRRRFGDALDVRR
jgi:excisionase family DNA binding protein